MLHGNGASSREENCRVAVDVEAGVVFPVCHDEPLVGRMALIDDGIAEIALFGFKGNTVGVGEERNERGQYDKCTRTDGVIAGVIRV